MDKELLHDQNCFRMPGHAERQAVNLCKLVFRSVGCLSLHRMWGPWHHPMALHGAKVEGALPECRRGDRLSLVSSHRGQAEQLPGVLRSGSASITELAGSQTGWRESSVSNQTPVCLWQVCPHRPFSEQSTAESRTNTSLKGPVFHLIEFKLTVQKPWCFFISSMPSAAAEGIPWAPIPPTSQDLLTREVCCYCSFPVLLKQCPRWVPEGLAENLGACVDNTSTELLGRSSINNCF